MNCRICGAEDVIYRPTKLQALCDPCDQNTPDKLSKVEFEKVYWGDGVLQVPLSTRNEFYDDYLASDLDLPGYITATKEVDENLDEDYEYYKVI